MWRSKRHLESGIGGDTECRIARWIGGFRLGIGSNGLHGSRSHDRVLDLG